MRIIYVTATFPFGPGEAFVMPELAALQAQGHELLVVPLWPRGDVVHKDASCFLSSTLSVPFFSPRIAQEFAAAVTHRASSVWALTQGFTRATPWAMVKNLAALPKAAWLASVAKNWKADHIHAYWASVVASLALAGAELSGIPWSFTAHRFDIIENNLLEWKAERAKFVRFVSQSGLRMSGLQGTALAPKANVLHVGINVNGRPPSVPRQGTRVIALCAANMVPVKAHAVLVSAFEKLKRHGNSLELWLVGEGELRDTLRRDICKRGLDDRIKFLGVLSHSDLMSLYASGTISIAVLASADLGHGLHEGIPVSLMEAMSCAIPAIGTATGGIPELLGDGAGLIVPPQNPDAMADVLHLLSQDQGLRHSLGRAGQERVRERFAAPKIAAQMAGLFSDRLECLAAAS